MAGSIKGITIEIGGNTTPLQKALKDVNSSSASLKTELREVERLLKLDPTNTTLLAQKQELLGKQVETTKEKLERLKSVEEQVEQQFKDGEIDEGQYRAFQRELAKTEAELNKVEQQSGETGNEVKDAGKKAEQSGKDAEDGRSKWESFGNALKTVGEVAGKALAALGTAAIGAGTAIVGMTTAAAYNADEINTLAKQTGLSVEQIQKFQFASEQIDVSLDTLTGSMSKLTKNMDAARGGTGSAAEAFEALGISVVGVDGQLRDNEDVFNETIAALGKIENETERDALAMSIFGKSAQDLNPLILGGAETLEELGKQAEEAGLILSGDALDSLNTLSDAIDTAKGTVKGLGNLFGTVFAEDFAGIVNDFTGYAQRLGHAFKDGGVDGLADEFGTVLGDIVNQIAEVLPKIVKGGLQIVEKLAKTIISNAGQITEAAIEIVVMLTQSLVSALPMLAEAAVEILTTIINSVSEQLPTLIPFIVQAVADVALSLVEQLPTLLEALVQLVEGLALGIIDALPIIIEVLPDLITGIVDALTSFIPQIIRCGITIFVALVENLPAIIEGIVAALPEIIDSVIEGFVGMIPQLVDCGVKLFIALIQNLPKILVEVGKAVPKIVTSLVSGFKTLFSSLAEVGAQLFGQLIARGGEILSTLGSFVSGLMSNVISILSSWFSSFSEIGYNIVSGIWSGLSAGWGWLTSQVSNLASSLLNAAKNALGIHSPSTKFRDEIGKMMAAGIGEGFDVEIPKTFSNVKSALKTQEAKLASSVTNSTTHTVNNSTSLGGIAVYITGNVGNVGEARKIGDAVAEEVQRRLRYKGVLSLA